MNVVSTILVAWAGFLPMGFLVWGLWCIYRTHESRMRMIYDAAKMPTPIYMAHMHAFDQVSFGQHVKMLFIFRNPLKLYPKVGVVTVRELEFGQSESMN